MSLKDRTLARMAQLGIVPKRSLGQNFLVSDGVVQKIIESVRRSEGPILEIGPGLGALTDKLLELQRPYRAIELDQRFAGYWRDQGQEILEADALHVEWGTILKAPTVLVSNLPYQISSRLVVDLSFQTLPIQKMVFMFQKEVAERIMAAPRTENYGLLSVVAQLFWKIERVTNAGTHDFLPPPNVTSRVLQFQPHPKAPAPTSELLSFIKLAFSKRRKFLTNNLESSYNREVLLPVLEKIGQKPTVRAEELDPVQMYTLFSLCKRGNEFK